MYNLLLCEMKSRSNQLIVDNSISNRWSWDQTALSAAEWKWVFVCVFYVHMYVGESFNYWLRIEQLWDDGTSLYQQSALSFIGVMIMLLLTTAFFLHLNNNAFLSNLRWFVLCYKHSFRITRNESNTAYCGHVCAMCLSIHLMRRPKRKPPKHALGSPHARNTVLWHCSGRGC